MTIHASVPSKTADSPHNAGNIKDTIQSIIVAFILAFIFRTFVVEAFVIPTGSMATTLLGAHTRFKCSDCGYEFTLNFSAKQGSDLEIPRDDRIDWRNTKLYCPNCGYKLTARDTDVAGGSSLPVHYGDRILVLKYLYLLDEPDRWDVVVFKSPATSADGKTNYTDNYIKRLIGKPLEQIMILDGDIYVREKNSSDFVIQAKPPIVQDALWRVIYDNDYLPRRMERSEGQWKQPWQENGGTGWGKPQRQRVFTFDDLTGSSSLQFDASANDRTNGLTDWSFYNTQTYRHGAHAVSDLKLSCIYKREEGDGPFRLQLTKLGRTFTAEITPGRVRLLDRGVEIGAANVPSLARSNSASIEFENVDYRVSIRIDGRVALATSAQQYHPDLAALRDDYRDEQNSQNDFRSKRRHPDISISAERQKCEIAHLRLSRDVYYTNDLPRTIVWGTPRNPILLGPDEYFVLGDNSMMSSDARYWTNAIQLPAEDLDVEAGRVPGRFLLGKAFFVYWPAGYRPISSLPGIIPNFGEMRFIH